MSNDDLSCQYQLKNRLMLLCRSEFRNSKKVKKCEKSTIAKQKQTMNKKKKRNEMASREKERGRQADRQRYWHRYKEMI